MLCKKVLDHVSWLIEIFRPKLSSSSLVDAGIIVKKINKVPTKSQTQHRTNNKLEHNCAFTFQPSLANKYSSTNLNLLAVYWLEITNQADQSTNVKYREHVNRY